jgi:hypothetical protein
MVRFSRLLVIPVLLTVLLLSAVQPVRAENTRPAWLSSSMAKLEEELGSRYGEASRVRLTRGMDQVANFWRPEDGGAAEFEKFVTENFAGDTKTKDAMFARCEMLLEQFEGHLLEVRLAFRKQADLDLGPILPLDQITAAYDPAAHVLDDFFENKLAFAVLLNFPLTTLEERLDKGKSWTRREWAEARLAQRFSKRIPAEVNLAISQASADADRYISEYNIWMHHLLTEKGQRLFPPKLRLLSHWNLRDELKAQYSNAEGGLERQRTIQEVMERIVTQTIPAVVVNNPHVDWCPFTNEVKPAAVQDAEEPPQAGLDVSGKPEPDTRYATLFSTFLAARMADPYSPTAPTLIARRFEEDREIPEDRVRAMFEEVLTSPLVPRVASLIAARLGRPLEPFDIWYNGFKPRSAYTEPELDANVRKKYPTSRAFEKDIPNILTKLDFTKETALFLSDNIVVDPARGSGHAWGSALRGTHAHLRTRVGADGMDYKGYNIAVHELGHNVEQVFSLERIDHWLLKGVPNTAFTEAFAFVFQGKDLALLGLVEPDPESEALKTVDDFWMTFEIAGVALVDMEVWRWMYEHPEATPAELKQAVIRISRDIWNRYYAPVIGKEDVVLLGIYSHMIDAFLYLPDYPLGHLIAFQIEEKMRSAGSVGSEFERMATQGSIAPDLWMEKATGSPVGPGALLTATERALAKLEASH